MSLNNDINVLDNIINDCLNEIFKTKNEDDNPKVPEQINNNEFLINDEDTDLDNYLDAVQEMGNCTYLFMLSISLCAPVLIYMII
jgi:hypothetical protein